MTYRTGAEIRPERLKPPIAGRSPRKTHSLRVVPGSEGFEDLPQYHGDDRKTRQRKQSSSSAALFLVVLILGAALSYAATRPGAIDQLLSAPVQPEAPATLPQSEEFLAPEPRQSGPTFAETALAPQMTPAPSNRPPVPDMAGLGILIRTSLAALGHANQTSNYSVLREIASPRFQEANTPAGLSDAFTDLRNRNPDLTLATALPPSLRRDPVVDERGMLHVAGSFADPSASVDFSLVFELIDGRWRIFAIGVLPTGTTAAEPASADASIPPDPTALVAFIRSHVIALNQANMTGNYSVLREMAAPGFQAANSFAQLATIFGALRARQLDLGPVAVLEPKLYRPPAIDQRGMLRLTGYFPSEPERVNFDLAFQNVAGKWRLFGIGVNTSREVAAGTAPTTPDSGGTKSETVGSKAPSPQPATPPRPPERPAL